MENHSVPAEILVQIFNQLKKADLKNCVLVNKSWNTVAQSFFQGLRVEICGTQELYKDLSSFPGFASKVTKLTANRRAGKNWLNTLKLCPNLLVLEFGYFAQWILARALAESNVQLPKIQEITFMRYPETSRQSNYIWQILSRHSQTLMKFNIDFFHPVPDRPDIVACLSRFPKLVDLEASSLFVESFHTLLLETRNIKKLTLYDVNISENAESFCVPHSNLQVLELKCKTIHINALRCITQILDKLERFEIQTHRIIVDDLQSRDEVNSITAAYFPSLRGSIVDVGYFRPTRQSSYDI